MVFNVKGSLDVRTARARALRARSVTTYIALQSPFPRARSVTTYIALQSPFPATSQKRLLHIRVYARGCLLLCVLPS